MAKEKVFRLIPHRSEDALPCTMFDLRDAIGCKLVTGNNWGDDYLVVDAVGVEMDGVVEFLDESGYPYEEVAEVPYHLKGYL